MEPERDGVGGDLQRDDHRLTDDEVRRAEAPRESFGEHAKPVVAERPVMAAVVMLARLGVPRRRFREGGHSEAPSGRWS